MNIVGNELTVQLLQATVVNSLDVAPVQARQLGNMGNWQKLGQRFDPGAEPQSHAGSTVEPGNVLNHPRSAVVAIHATDRYIQPNTPVKPVTLSDLPTTTFMDQNTRLSATATAYRRLRILGQFQNQRAIELLTERFNTMPFPEDQAQNSIRLGGGLDD